MQTFLLNDKIKVTLYGDNDNLKPSEQKLINFCYSIDLELSRMFKKLNPEAVAIFGGRHAFHTAGAIAFILDRMGIKVKVYVCAFIEDRILYNHSFVIADVNEYTYIIDMGRGHHRVNPIKNNNRLFIKWKRSFLDSESLIRDRYLQSRGVTTFSEFVRVPISAFTQEDKEFFTHKRGIDFLNTVLRKKVGEMKYLRDRLRYEGVIT